MQTLDTLFLDDFDIDAIKQAKLFNNIDTMFSLWMVRNAEHCADLPRFPFPRVYCTPCVSVYNMGPEIPCCIYWYE